MELLPVVTTRVNSPILAKVKCKFLALPYPDAWKGGFRIEMLAVTIALHCTTYTSSHVKAYTQGERGTTYLRSGGGVAASPQLLIGDVVGNCIAFSEQSSVTSFESRNLKKQIFRPIVMVQQCGL